MCFLFPFPFLFFLRFCLPHHGQVIHLSSAPPIDAAAPATTMISRSSSRGSRRGLAGLLLVTFAAEALAFTAHPRVMQRVVARTRQSSSPSSASSSHPPARKIQKINDFLINFIQIVSRYQNTSKNVNLFGNYQKWPFQFFFWPGVCYFRLFFFPKLLKIHSKKSTKFQ